MYEAFYSLREPPFEFTPNPKFLFLTPRHREALSNLEYGLLSAKPITLLIGEAGTGKTTLLRAVLESARGRDVRCLTINNPVLTPDEFVRSLAIQLALSDQAARSKATFLAELEPLLLSRRSHNEITALIVDEAQSLSVDLLEEIRLLANIETATEKLLPVVLTGQPELAERLERPELRQLKQRVALRCEIGPLQLNETASFIASRITTAGGVPSRVFTREAVTLVHEHSGGIPRLINVICNNALVSGLALGRRPADRAIVLEVCRDFHLPRTDGEMPRGGGSAAEPRTESQSRAPAAAPDRPGGVGDGGLDTEDPPAKPTRLTRFGSGSS